MKNKPEEIWITNISNKDVFIQDLKYLIPAKSSTNFLGRGFKLTKEQILESISSGSIFQKSNLLKLRKVPPEPPFIVKLEVSKEPLYTTQLPPRSMHKIEIPQFDELNDSTIDFINELTEED
jgi:hypothetical protein